MSVSELDDIPIPRRDVTDVDVYSSIGVGVSWYAWTSYRGFAAASLAAFARDVAHLHSLPTAGYNWENVDVMNYVRQGEHHSRHFGVVPVERHAEWVIRIGETQVSLYGAWRMSMMQWGKPTTHRAHVQMDIPLLRY